MVRIFAIGAALAAVIMVGATAVYTFGPIGGGDPFEPCRQTRIASGAAALGGSVSLVREDGTRVSEADMFAEPALVYFGFTFCPDVCPLDLARNAASVDILAERGMSLPLYFVSIDPARDTPEAIADYTSHFGENVIGMTGTEDDISKAANAFRVYYAKNGDGEDYLMDHSTFTYLVGTDAKVIEIFRRDMPEEQLADALACFLDKV